MRTICWFSCGAASAVAAKLTLEQSPDALVVYCNTLANEHPDNARFFVDIERWLGTEILMLSSKRFGQVEEVFDARKYMAGIAGAPCTVELKKLPRFEFQKPDDRHVFGYTADEGPRILRFEINNPELNLFWVLRDKGYKKADCLRVLEEAGIAIPIMYQLGYRNNNCLGCVKASSRRYWSKIRKNFPEVFARRVEQSRRIGAKLLQLKGKHVYLDELPEGEYMRGKMENISCGPECGVP